VPFNPRLRRQICNVLRVHGSLSVRELQAALGERRGNCSLWVLDYFCPLKGLSTNLRDALYVLLWRGDIEIVPVRRTLRLRLSR
jgi:hypothetical protein